MTAFHVVIPARFASSRLPGKPLADIHGKPMIVRVLEQARRSGAGEVWVATDDMRIAEAVKAHGGNALITRTDHATGTDRLAEVVETLGWADDTLVVNLQGDEPLIPPQLLDIAARTLAADPEAAIATAAHPVQRTEDLFNPNIVKVICNQAGRALYFSRAPIPWARDAFALERPAQLPATTTWLRHIGLYAYRAHFLKHCHTLTPCTVEQEEALEQLRALWHGYAISVFITAAAPAAGVDTETDLQRVRAAFAI